MISTLRLLLLLLCTLAGIMPASAEAPAAAYVTGIALSGADQAEGTTIRREGKAIRPRLLMPLFEGDEVFLRDAASRIVLETAAGAEEVVSGADAHFVVKGAAEADGGFWNMLGSVADALGGDDGDVAPDNMMTRDMDDIVSIPMAIRGANRIVADDRPLWLSWRGGKAPYSLHISGDSSMRVQQGITMPEFTLGLPVQSPKRLKVSIEDAEGRKASISLRLSEKRPEPPFSLSDGRGQEAAKILAYAAWLTSLDDGSWTLEAARMLRTEAADNPAAAQLLARIATGWKAGGARSPSP